jgi:UDP-N-acetylenolpyruvoylglucosamine reductase
MTVLQARNKPDNNSGGVAPASAIPNAGSAGASPEAPPHIADDLIHLVSLGTIVRRDEPLAKKTTLRVGGPADVYVEPCSESDLAAVFKFCSTRKIPFFILGRGSNLLVRDGGFRGVVISLSDACFSRIERTGEKFLCGAGARLKALSNEARRANITGLEFFEGIPGTVGGALRMNAGAMGGQTFEVVESVRMMDFHGQISEKTPAEMRVAYRHCADLQSQVAVSAVLYGWAGSKESIDSLMSEFSRKRWRSQPAAPSAGCIFKNPPTISAGKLIEELGLKGTRVGGAAVSQEHGNFIITESGATARDVLELIGQIQTRAREKRGIDLQTEVQIIGH